MFIIGKVVTPKGIHLVRAGSSVVVGEAVRAVAKTLKSNEYYYGAHHFSKTPDSLAPHIVSNYNLFSQYKLSRK
jgi:hypothetical protein